MGGAAARAFAAYVVEDRSDVTVVSRTKARLKKFKQSGMSTAVLDSVEYRDAVSSADMVFIVIPPAGVRAISAGLSELMDFNRQMVVCMAPGVNDWDLAAWLGQGAPLPMR